MIEDDELSGLFAAERAVRAPVGASARGLSRLLVEVSAPVVAPPAAAATSAKLVEVSKWIVTGFVVGIGGSGVLAQVFVPSSAGLASPSITQPRAVPPKPIASSVDEASPAPESASAEQAAPVPGGETLRSVASASNEPGRFDAELRLITLAKRELDAGQPRLAKLWLAEHAQRFPGGVFSPDRDALSVLVHCAEQRDPSAARSFAARHPGSPMTVRLLRACESTTPIDSTKETRRAGAPTRE